MPDHDITAADVYPYNDTVLGATTNSKDVTDPSHLKDARAEAKKELHARAKIRPVLETIDTLFENGIEDTDKLREFGKRMSSLIYHAGIPPSEAKASATKEFFLSGRTLEDLANLLDMSKGGLNKISRNANSSRREARHLHYMTFNVPMNLVLDEKLRAEPPADYKLRYVILETVNPRTDDVEVRHYDRHGPDTQLAPAEPQYVVITEVHTPDPNWSADDPETRTFGPFHDMTVEWYMDEDELTDALYESKYFNTVDRAETWYDLLTRRGFDLDADPRDRVNPDMRDDLEEPAR